MCYIYGKLRTDITTSQLQKYKFVISQIIYLYPDTLLKMVLGETNLTAHKQIYLSIEASTSHYMNQGWPS